MAQTTQRAEEGMEAEYFLKSHLFMIFLELMICFEEPSVILQRKGFLYINFGKTFLRTVGVYPCLRLFR